MGGSCNKEAELVYFGNRYYSPELKQWITPDPAFQSLDLYQYCFNNPFFYFDPDGRTSEKAQEHYDNATQALIEALAHSMTAGLIIECPPLAIIEGYEAVQAWKEAAKEFNAGVDEDKKEREEK